MTVTTAEPTEEISSALEDLTGHDRCDRCGAQAFVRVQLYSGTELVFCGHHYAAHEPALAEQALRVRDERSRINVKPSVSV